MAGIGNIAHVCVCEVKKGERGRGAKGYIMRVCA